MKGMLTVNRLEHHLANSLGVFMSIIPGNDSEYIHMFPIKP